MATSNMATPKLRAMRTLALVAAIALTAACRARRSAEASMEMGAADSTDQRASAAAHVAEMRTALEQYRDVRVAESDGFRQFLPGLKQPIYHFTNSRWALEEMFRFNAAKPTSLLYRQEPDGRFVLLGAMYTAPARASVGERERWRETRDGAPLFGPQSPIASAAACAVVGGRFLPRIFGWMVHVMAFESDDPKVIWGGGHDHRHS